MCIAPLTAAFRLSSGEHTPNSRRAGARRLMSQRSLADAQLLTRLAPSVHQDGVPRRLSHLHMMLDVAVKVSHIPVVRRTALGGFAATDITIHRPATAGAGANGRAGHGAAGSCDVLPGSLPDLMAEHATNDAADDAARHTAAASIHRFAFHPATLFRTTHHGMHRGDSRLVDTLVRAPAIFVSGLRQRFGCEVVIVAIAAHPADR